MLSGRLCDDTFFLSAALSSLACRSSWLKLKKNIVVLLLSLKGGLKETGWEYKWDVKERTFVGDLGSNFVKAVKDLPSIPPSPTSTFFRSVNKTAKSSSKFPFFWWITFDHVWWLETPKHQDPVQIKPDPDHYPHSPALSSQWVTLFQLLGDVRRCSGVGLGFQLNVKSDGSGGRLHFSSFWFVKRKTFWIRVLKFGQR